jgi:uncharacterized membrane protein YhaH (DUF805 family)
MRTDRRAEKNTIFTMGRLQSNNAASKAPQGRVNQRPYWLVLLSVIIRALHQVGAAVYLSSFLLAGVQGPPAFYLLLAALTGVGLLVTEGARHTQLYREVAGCGTFVKLALLGAAYHQYLPAPATVTAAFLVAAVAAHLPKDLRHRLVF